MVSSGWIRPYWYVESWSCPPLAQIVVVEKPLRYGYNDVDCNGRATHVNRAPFFRFLSTRGGRNELLPQGKNGRIDLQGEYGRASC